MPPKTAKFKHAIKSSAAKLRPRQVSSSAEHEDSSANESPSSNQALTRPKRPSTRRGLRISKLGRGRGGIGRGTGRDAISPLEGEKPLVVLRVRVVGCSDLLAKDRNGFSDPFVTLSLPPHPTRHTTPVVKRTLSPDFPAAHSTFDFPIYLSTAERLGVLECVVWDKDFLLGGDVIGMGVGRKEYLGEVGVRVEDWFGEREMGWDAEGNGVLRIPLESTRTNTNAKGSIELKIGFVEGEMGLGFEEVYRELLRRSRTSLVSAPPTEGVGTVRSCRSRVYRRVDKERAGEEHNADEHSTVQGDAETASEVASAPVPAGDLGEGEGYMLDDGGLSSAEEEEDYEEDEEGEMIHKEDRSFVQVSELDGGASASEDGSTDEFESGSESESENENESENEEREEEGAAERDVMTPTILSPSPPLSSEPEDMGDALSITTDIGTINTTPKAKIARPGMLRRTSSPSPSPTSSFSQAQRNQSFGALFGATSLLRHGEKHQHQQQQQGQRSQPPTPLVNLTPASPDLAAGDSTTPTPTTAGSTPRSSAHPHPHSHALLTPKSPAVVIVTPANGASAKPYSSSPSHSPPSPGLSGMLPRMKFSKVKRSLSAGGGAGAGGLASSAREGENGNGRGTFDLTEDVPRIAEVGGRRVRRDEREKEKEKEKKGVFRRSWSAGVRRASFGPGNGTPYGSGSGSGSGSSGSGSGGTSSGAESGSSGNGIPAIVNLDAASKAATGDTAVSKKSKRKGSKTGDGTLKVKKQKKKKKSSTTAARGEFMFGGGNNDVVGIVMLEIDGADDLPKLKNMTRTGWDMDPFVVISFGKKVFRTRVIRHSRNPSWDEKLLFHVRRYETNFKVKLTVLDWDKLSSNDYIGECDFGVAELIEQEGMSVDPVTGLYPLVDSDGAGGFGSGNASGVSQMKEFRMRLKTAKEMPWESKHHPMITFRAKYQPYAALRQRFWLQYLKQYDTDDTGTLSHLEITSMLDSLGSTLTNSTINSFFTRFNKSPFEEELTIPEAIQCLETELGRPMSEKKRVGSGTEDEGEGMGTGTGTSASASVSATPVLMLADRRGKQLSLDELDFSGPPLSAMVMAGGALGNGQQQQQLSPLMYETEPAQQVLAGVAAPVTPSTTASSSAATTPSKEYTDRSLGSEEDEEDEGGAESSSGSPPISAVEEKKTKKKGYRFRKPKAVSMSDSHLAPTSATSVSFAPNTAFPPSSSSAPALSSSSNVSTPSPPEHPVERVINVKNCPLCHRPRLSSKAEVDIVTHLAVCASQDWNKVDRIVVGNFVTASQAQRKWYTRVLSKVSSGDYKLGANSANIIVQNRMTGQLEEEKMQVYVRLGIRLLYKGMKSRMEGGRARRLLKSLSIKQGVKYDSPESARDIPAFISFHGLDMAEVRDPLESFKTFNQFFYRKLKATARPVDAPEDPYRLVSAADCRFMAFETVSEASRLWIKGREFTVARLLGDAYKDEVEKYNGGALAIFRLAPQDYHRFHSPVDGKIGKMTYISGEYYTVNPQAIRTALDVYGENARKIVPIDSPQFGRVMAVCIGAMMVGTIKTTVEEGQYVKRGEEFGYFAFGGSTIVILFEKGVVEWDEDLLINGRAALETLVRVGMGIGNGTRKPLTQSLA